MLRRPGLPERRRATTKVPWYLLWPDSHRLVIVNLQDARADIKRCCWRSPRAAYAGQVARASATGESHKACLTRLCTRETGQPGTGPHHIQRRGGDDVLESCLGQPEVFGAAQAADVDGLGECALHSGPSRVLVLERLGLLSVTSSPEGLLLFLRTEAHLPRLGGGAHAVRTERSWGGNVGGAANAPHCISHRRDAKSESGAAQTTGRSRVQSTRADTIQRLEAGGSARLSTVRRLAEALEVKPADLTGMPPAD